MKICSGGALQLEGFGMEQSSDKRKLVTQKTQSTPPASLLRFLICVEWKSIEERRMGEGGRGGRGGSGGRGGGGEGEGREGGGGGWRGGRGRLRTKATSYICTSIGMCCFYISEFALLHNGMRHEYIYCSACVFPHLPQAAVCIYRSSSEGNCSILTEISAAVQW